MHKLLITAGLVLGSVTLAPAAFAQDAHAGHDMGGDNAEPSVSAYVEAMDRMHAAMGEMDYTGDADIDFAVGMIPHHQAAIDMANIVLEHGDDPEIAALAQEIIEAQEAEIAQLEAWLAENGGN
ncbi:DUF305 domain-containing protein [Pelagibacterium sp. 26DY04]|uniref:CopM family metallochaperone n=1 Tax=unclassified Pelagibacterium TaxID=2623280 RepID=UPI002814E60E|nr:MULTISPECIES: DUF305 domain-containing protein [unclassified Pelagibacterium]WMT85948.1 DUF305 domain-containing protein [Pelagibacterium sp. 26DY04]WMT89766.1 DUF305 domain-containing protein [Pelagibacterium sp. H642]